MMQRASCFAAMLRTLPDDKGDFVEDGFYHNTKCIKFILLFIF